MHGFIIRGIELFVRTRHDEGIWIAVSSQAGINPCGAMIMRQYHENTPKLMVQAASDALRISREEFLEDIGGWIPCINSVRHIMRFSGATFEDFVLSLDDLHDRGRVVLPGLNLPRIVINVISPNCYRLSISADQADWYPVLTGFLRGMADDYGVLAIVNQEESGLCVRIADDTFAEGRAFSLIKQSGTDG